jgi:peptide subunit release factor 1 (eRF1)
MEHRGATSPGAVAVDDLRPVVEAEGPFATVLLGTDPAEANPRPRWEQRWKTVRRTLADAGTARPTLEHLDGAAAGAYRHGGAFYAVADAERLWVAESWPEPPRHEILRLAALPSLAPVLEQRQREVAHVVALVDRTGADIVSIERGGAAHDREVTGEDGPVIRKSAPGGWSQRRYHARAEESWAHTAREIADALVAAVDDVDAEVLVLAGDVREVALVQAELPARVGDLTHVVHGGRAAGTDEVARHHDVERLLRTAVADATVELLRKLREELGQHDRGVTGAAATVAALQQARVEALLVHDDPADTRTAWFGRAPTELGLDRDTAGFGTDDALREGRLVDVVLRSALGTGAQARIVPTAATVDDGLGAILRWAGPTAR